MAPSTGDMPQPCGYSKVFASSQRNPSVDTGLVYTLLLTSSVFMVRATSLMRADNALAFASRVKPELRALPGSPWVMEWRGRAVNRRGGSRSRS